MSKARILIVEDESIISMTIEQTLNGLGFEVAGVARTGEQAIKLAEETRPDLVLMDIRLAGQMDGIEAAGQIRARFELPVIYLTSHGDNAILERAKVTSPHGYILKPFEDREIQIAIEMALYKHRAEMRALADAEEKQRLHHELQEATKELHELQKDLLTICAWTKQVRSGDKWESVESFLSRRLRLKLTHGISDDVANGLLAEMPRARAS